MTRDEDIYKNATQIAEQRIRTARKLQANEAKGFCMAKLTTIKLWVFRSKSALRGATFLGS